MPKYHRLRALSRSQAIAESAQNLAASDPEQVFRQANAAYRQGDMEQTKPKFEQLLSMDVTFGRAIYNLAMLHMLEHLGNGSSTPFM